MQQDIARTLESHQAKATQRLDALKQERAALVENVASLRLRHLVPAGTRKQVFQLLVCHVIRIPFFTIVKLEPS